MEVTKQNFEVVFPRFVNLLKECDFYAFDCEMTGIPPRNLQSTPIPSFYQTSHQLTPEAIFPEKEAAAKKYSIIQLGICLFRKRTKAEEQKANQDEGVIATSASSPTAAPYTPIPVVHEDNDEEGPGSFFVPVQQEYESEGEEGEDENHQTKKVEKKYIDNNSSKKKKKQQSGDGEEEVSSPGEIKKSPQVKRKGGEAGEKNETEKGASEETKKQPSSSAANTACSKAGGACEDLGDFSVYPFNFYLFPSGDQDVTLHASTCSQFLTQHHMNFSKWISSGIPYVSVEIANKMRKKEHESAKLNEEKFNKANLEVLMKDAVFKSIRLSADQLAMSKNNRKDGFYLPFINDPNVYAGVMDYLAFKKLKKVHTGDKNPKKRYGVQIDEGQLFVVNKAIGGTKLFEALCACQKPVIGHNCFLDFLYVYHAFHDAPLKTYRDFKIFLGSNFPIIYDTRTLVTLPSLIPNDPQLIHRLEGQYTYFMKRIEGKGVKIHHEVGFLQFHPQLLNDEGNHGAHEASYDAFMTGSLFLYMQSFLGVEVCKRYVHQIAVYGSIYSLSVQDLTKDAILTEGVILFVEPVTFTLHMAARSEFALKNTELSGRAHATSEDPAKGVIVDCATGVEGMKKTLKENLLAYHEALQKSMGVNTTVTVIYPPNEAGLQIK